VIKSISLLTRKEGMTHEQFDEQKRPAIPSTEASVDGIAGLW
jgi:hypothetical protein